MTPVIALTTEEAEAIARASAALSWVRADTFPWAFAQGGEIGMYAAGLRESLEDYAALTTRRTHPATVFPDLEDGRDNAMETALDRVTQDIRDWTEALADLAQKAEDAARRQEEGMAA
jgi:hypothetical protein